MKVYQHIKQNGSFKIEQPFELTIEEFQTKYRAQFSCPADEHNAGIRPVPGTQLYISDSGQFLSVKAD